MLPEAGLSMRVICPGPMCPTTDVVWRRALGSTVRNAGSRASRRGGRDVGADELRHADIGVPQPGAGCRQDGQDRAGGDGPGNARLAQRCRQRLVPLLDRAVGVPQLGKLRLDLPCQFRFRVTQRLDLGDVPEHGDNAGAMPDTVPLRTQVHGREGQRPGLAPNLDPDRLASDILAAADRVQHRLGEIVQSLEGEEGLAETIPRRRSLGKPQHPDRCCVAGHDPAARLHHEDPVLHAVEDACNDRFRGRRREIGDMRHH